MKFATLLFKIKFSQFRYNCICLFSLIPFFFILSRIPTSYPCFISNKDGNYHSGCNNKVIYELEINKDSGLKKKEEKKKKSIFCIPHYICTFRRNRTIPHSHITSEYSFQGSMLTKEDASDHHRTIDIEDSKVLHRKTLLVHN